MLTTPQSPECSEGLGMSKNSHLGRREGEIFDYRFIEIVKFKGVVETMQFSVTLFLILSFELASSSMF